MGLGAICLLVASAHSPIDYQPKTLIKELEKSGILDFSSLKEISLEDSAISESVNGKFFRIEAANANRYKYLYIGRVHSCRAGSCILVQDQSVETEYFDYYMLLDDNKTVQNVKIFNYQATHGHEVTAKGWLKQFIGYNGSEPLQVDKNIDAISGATISVHAITSDIEQKTEMFVELR